MDGTGFPGIGKKDWAAFTALAVLCIVAWRGLFDQYFLEDDFLSMYLGKIMSLGSMFGTSPNFRPLDRLYFFISYRLFGLEPLGYNITGVGLHLANSCLIYLLGRPLFNSRLAGFAAAAFFATANIQSDAVFWVSARPGLLSLLFLLVSMNLWVLFKQTGRPAPWYYLTLFSLALALFSKEEAVVYPLLLILTDRLLLKGYGKGDRKWAWYAGALALMAVYAAYQAQIQIGSVTRSVNIKGGVYVLGANVPANLMDIFLYMFTPSFLSIQSLSPAVRIAGSILVVAALLAAGYFTAQKRASLWAVAWIAVAFLPMSLFSWTLVPSVETSFIRRYLYAPSVGVAFIFGLFIAWLYRSYRSGYAMSVAAAAVLALVICWNIFQLGEREMFWRVRKDMAHAEAAAVRRLYPSLPSPGTGVYMNGFAQHDVFLQPMLRLMYNNEGLKLYPDANSLLKDSSPPEKVLLYKKGDSVMAFPSGRAVRITE